MSRSRARRTSGASRSRASIGRTEIATTARPKEIEIALGFEARALRALVRHPAIAAAKQGRARTARLVSAYYDTAQRTLAHAGIALRVRREGDRYVQTVKGPAERATTPALRARAEYEWPLERAAIDVGALRATPWARRFAQAARAGLRAQFTTDFVRRTIPITLSGGTRAIVCIDVGGIRAPKVRRRATISEIEIELVDGNAAALYAFARSLAHDVPLAILPANKAERGYALANGESIGEPARARDVALRGETRAAAALAAIARECLRHVTANARGVMQGDDPEWVHQMRVGLRRLRACLALVARLDRPPSVAPIAAELKALASVLGAARDLDVLATETLPAIASTAHDDDRRAALADFDRRVRERRRATRADVRRAIESPRYTELVLAVSALVDALDAGDDALPLRDTARRLLARRQKQLDRRANRAHDGGGDERHAVRIAAKKLRYAVEFFAPLYPRATAQRYRDALARLQKVLGEENDWLVATRLAADIGPKGAADAARAHAQSLEQRHAAAFRRACERVERLEPPWRSD